MKLAISNLTIPYPSGICSIVDCNTLLLPPIQNALIAATIFCSVLYVMEKGMVIVTTCMFLISLAGFTLEESNGIFMRSGLYTMVFFAQAIAYYRNNKNLRKERIQFAVQVIAAGYVLAGISKLKESGLQWVAEAPQAALQMLKTYAYYYYDSGDIAQLNIGMAVCKFALTHPILIKCLFAFSLGLELFAWIALRSKKYAFAFGVLLVTMHCGIFYFMHILVAAVFYPMLIFFVNPIYLFFRLLKWTLEKISYSV
jgi:hypothetical protein